MGSFALHTLCMPKNTRCEQTCENTRTARRYHYYVLFIRNKTVYTMYTYVGMVCENYIISNLIVLINI